MKKVKVVVVRNSGELGRALGLSAGDMVEIEVRRVINDKIVEAVKGSRMTHVAVAKAARTSRSRLTAVLNRNTSQVSTDLMLRILAAVGWRAKVSFSRVGRAA